MSKTPGLDAAQRNLLGFYRVLLWVLLLVVLGAVAYIVLRYARPGTGLQGEWFYFGVLVVVVVGWLGGQLILVTLRARRLDRPAAPWPVLPNLTMDSRQGEGERSWQIRFGNAPPAGEGGGEPGGFTFSRTFRGPVRSLPPEAVADEATLDRIESELEQGADLEAAIAVVQPASVGWRPLERSAYRLYVRSLLDERLRGRGGS